MSSDKPDRPDKKGSGEHPAMIEAHRMIDEARANLLPQLERQLEKLDRAVDPNLTPPPLSTADVATEWTITIRGSGRHHNHEATDANRMALGFVHKLISAGHRIASATFDNGSCENILDPGAKPKKDEP